MQADKLTKILTCTADQRSIWRLGPTLLTLFPITASTQKHCANRLICWSTQDSDWFSLIFLINFFCDLGRQTNLNFKGKPMWCWTQKDWMCSTFCTYTIYCASHPQKGDKIIYCRRWWWVFCPICDAEEDEPTVVHHPSDEDNLFIVNIFGGGGDYRRLFGLNESLWSLFRVQGWRSLRHHPSVCLTNRGKPWISSN